MQVNVLTHKLTVLLSVVRASSRKEGVKAACAADGTFDLSLVWMWCENLAKSTEHVAAGARTAGVRLAAKEVLCELSPLIIAGAKRDPLLRAWESSARKYVGKDTKTPELRIVAEAPLRHLDGRLL